MMTIVCAAERRLIVAACALLLAWQPVRGAAPLASALGAEAPLAEPSGGYVGPAEGRARAWPERHAIDGDRGGTAPEQEFDLVWRTVKGKWKVADAEYHGREYEPVAYRIAKVRTDAAGNASVGFVAPEDYGFNHDIVLQQGHRLLNQTDSIST